MNRRVTVLLLALFVSACDKAPSTPTSPNPPTTPPSASEVNVSETNIAPGSSRTINTPVVSRAGSISFNLSLTPVGGGTLVHLYLFSTTAAASACTAAPGECQGALASSSNQTLSAYDVRQAPSTSGPYSVVAKNVGTVNVSLTGTIRFN